ncbi:hypothetical protein F4604DRAFT_1880040 [Suillus subluteus]|nr:hypothetical protein F4604DRAFT_1880040 [Suillus subluteus]
MDDIHTKFHQHARIQTRIEAFSDFMRHHHYKPPCLECQPWLPFRCQLDFKIAELAHEAALTHEQTTRLIQLVQRSRTEDFTLKNYADVWNTWEVVSHHLTAFESDTIMVLLDGTDLEYMVYFRPLWDWVVDILRHPVISPHYVFWECQSQIPPDAKPLAFILYADKSKLSSFGRKKGYPVIACLVNLPVTIRNGNRMGGGWVVGWLPLVKDDPKYKGTQQFANFKAAVWHASIKKVLACGMSLTRGVMSNFPCPVCLIPEDELSSVMPHTYTLHTSQATNALLTEARAECRKGQWEAILKSQSICDVINAFHDMNSKTTDGLFGDHMWPELQLLIGLLGLDIAVKIDKNFDGLPHWRNLNHFDAVMAITFTDGSKYEDIFKLITFVAHNLKVDLYAALEVHTTTMIAAGQEALQNFSELMNSQAIQPDKNWSFPKNHLAAHLFDNIEAKGATHNYNTKLNKKCHGPLKDSYEQWTNFKNVAPQVYLRADHWSLVSEFIRGRMAVDEDDQDTNIPSSFHIKLGSKQPQMSLEAIKEQYIDNPSFRCRRSHVNYESLVDFHQTTDYLHCSPSFHNLPRYDSGVFFARLIFLFTCIINDTSYLIALKDEHLNFWRVRSQPRETTRVALAPDPSTAGDFLVMDTVDSDIFLRMKHMHLAAGH